MNRLAVVIAVLGLSACRGQYSAQWDQRVLWDARGCAYFVRHNVSDAFFINPAPDLDKQGCPKP